MGSWGDGSVLSQVKMGLLASCGSFCSISNTGGRSIQSVPLRGFPDPLQVAADFGINTGLGGCVTGDITPGHNALQNAPTDQGTPGVTLWGEMEA